MMNVRDPVDKVDYEDYNSISKTYDNLRVPVGLDSLDKALELASKNIGVSKNSIKLLDVGCGTGNYLDILKDKVGSCTGLEINEGMLSKAQAKHKGSDKITFVPGDATNMVDFMQTESFDVVITTQTLHHMSMEVQRKVLVNIGKVLKPGGVFWTSTYTPDQLGGYWFHFLIPQAAALFSARFPGIPLLKKQLSDAGLIDSTIEVIMESTINQDQYYDLTGPFDTNYRNADSMWSLATTEELEAGLLWWRQQIEEGSAEDLLKKFDKRRLSVGQTISVTSVKPISN